MNGFKSGQKFERMKEIKPSLRFLSIFLVTFFLLPYIIFLKFFSIHAVINFSELIWVLKNTTLQGAGAAVICVVLGSYLALGILQLPENRQLFISKLILFPFVLPSLFSILISFSLIHPFPMGPVGVIFIFVLMNLGFSIFQITQAIKEKVGSLAKVSEVFGIRRNLFLRKILIPLIWPDLKLNFVFIFLFCISSLAVPLVAGGGKGTNLEVLIFEKIFIDQTWDIAWVLMVIQTLIVFTLSYYYLKSRPFETKFFQPHFFLKSKLALVGVGVYFFLYIGGYVTSLVHSFSYFESLVDFKKDILQSTIDSLIFMMLVLIACYVILMAWITDYIQNLKHNLAIHLISISTVLVGFSFYLLFPQTKNYDLVKIPLAFAILFFPSLFKMLFEKKLTQLKQQVIVAKVFGLSRAQIILQIIFKQMRPQLIMAISLLMIWVLSDFAISKSLGTQTITLGLLTQSFLSSYRLESAYLLSFYILIIWSLLSLGAYFILKESHGDDKKY